MDENGSDCAALAETTVFLQYFNDMPDERQPGKVMYPLDEILLLSLLAVLAGAEAFTDIARFGERKLDLLRRFRPFPNGTPAHDHLGDIFATLDGLPAAALRAFIVSSSDARAGPFGSTIYFVCLREPGTWTATTHFFELSSNAPISVLS
ncbi:transposase family protein [Methylosinus sp. PW1]|uniref:transposase family protein n=1 Tax=Methylosinus sp. PW1 TaxID=107636 RepID=UPI0006922DD0|nr:transposase family protein [Methylosinus sp. PW1]